MTELRRASLFILLLCASPSILHPQSAAHPAEEPSYYSRKNTFGLFTEYSNNSSHILVGNARNRKLAAFGATYTRRILLRPSVDIQYMAEVRPVLFESDPVTNVTEMYIGPPANYTQTSSNTYAPKCSTGPATTINGIVSSGPYQGSPYTLVFTTTCTRQWTFGQGFSPAGIKFNLWPRHRLQPVFTVAGGYMFSTKPIPTNTAGSYNFTIEFGAGVEFYHQHNDSASIFSNRSLRAEYRYHHISNGYTATQNPGIDSGLLQVTFDFGR